MCRTLRTVRSRSLRARNEVTGFRAVLRLHFPALDTLLQHLASWKPFRALVVGDFMLDQLWYGDAERLSADAPVPVLHVKRTEDRPGGAANVCLDLIAMGAEVHAFGVIGSDANGGTLRGA